MKKSIKTSLIVIALALVACLACFIWFVSRPGDLDRPVAESVSKTSGGTAFEVSVEKPRMDRFLGGILPIRLEEKLIGSALRFNHASPGARVGSVGQKRVELFADGWDLLIETDGEGKITPGTRLVFPIEIAEKQWTLRCRPADPAVGYLRENTWAGSGEIEARIDGTFLVELARCEDAATGKTLDTEAGGNPGDAWPSSPLTLRGSFVAPAMRPSPQPNADQPKE
jgi:hypothetical protein